MVLGPVLVGVVGGLVVIPDADERVPLMDCLQVGITAVLSIATPVVFKRNDLMLGIQRPRATIIAFAVLVDVVSEVEYEIKVAPAGHPAVGVEVGVSIVRTGADGDPQGLGAVATGRCKLGAANRRSAPERVEPVVVLAAPDQPLRIVFNRVVSLGAGDDAPGGHPVIERIV